MRYFTPRDRDTIDRHNANRRRKHDEKDTMFLSLMRRARKVETWVVLILVIVMVFSVVLPLLNKISAIFGGVAKVTGG